jgi:hypothetical protein
MNQPITADSSRPDTRQLPPAQLGGLVSAGVLLLACLLLTTGCGSMGQPASSGIASVEITNRTPDQIRDATLSVFREKGFTLGPSTPNELVFEQEGSKMDQVAYGNWMGGKVYIRAKVAIVPVVEGRYRLQCTPGMVRDKGDSFFEEDVKLANIRRRPYQDLLDQVAKRLK